MYNITFQLATHPTVYSCVTCIYINDVCILTTLSGGNLPNYLCLGELETMDV
jgi:hypothetical protein